MTHFVKFKKVEITYETSEGIMKHNFKEGTYFPMESVFLIPKGKDTELEEGESPHITHYFNPNKIIKMALDTEKIFQDNQNEDNSRIQVPARSTH